MYAYGLFWVIGTELYGSLQLGFIEFFTEKI